MSTARPEPIRHFDPDFVHGPQTQLAIENFPISGLTAQASLIRALLRVKAAAAHANEKLGVLTSAQAQAIQRAISLLQQPAWLERWPNLFPVDVYQAGAGTSQNMNVNEVIAKLAELHPNDHVNASQSTNDVYPTAMRLALLEESAPLLKTLAFIAQTFAQQAERWKPIRKAGRTHLQDAVPTRLGTEFKAYSIAMERCQRWLEAGRNSLREIGLGGSAVGNSINVPPGFAELCITQLSHFSNESLHVGHHLAYCMQSQASIAHYMSGLKLLSIEVTRIANDLRLLASGPFAGLAELQLPEVQAGSSIMPGKVNPSLLEMTNQVFFAVQGYEHTVTLAAQAGQLELNVMMPVMAYSAIEATRIATRALQSLHHRCLVGIEPNLNRLQEYFEKTPQLATLLSPLLGYDQTAALVREASKKECSVLELLHSRGLWTQALQDALERL